MSKRLQESSTIYLQNYGAELNNQLDFIDNNYDYFDFNNIAAFNNQYAESVSSVKQTLMNYVYKNDNSYLLELPKFTCIR